MPDANETLDDGLSGPRETSQAAPRRIKGTAELRALVGQAVGVSDWVPISQSMIDQFAALTGDDQWIHVDVERARRESRYGTTIAHGYLLLSLGPRLQYGLFTVTDVAMGVNYGLDRVRFLAPVPSGAAVRLRIGVTEVEDGASGTLVKFDHTYELEHSEKPACIARKLTLYVDAA